MGFQDDVDALLAADVAKRRSEQDELQRLRPVRLMAAEIVKAELRDAARVLASRVQPTKGHGHKYNQTRGMPDGYDLDYSTRLTPGGAIYKRTHGNNTCEWVDITALYAAGGYVSFTTGYG